MQTFLCISNDSHISMKAEESEDQKLVEPTEDSVMFLLLELLLFMNVQIDLVVESAKRNVHRAPVREPLNGIFLDDCESSE